jgi:hypothetical protein
LSISVFNDEALDFVAIVKVFSPAVKKSSRYESVSRPSLRSVNEPPSFNFLGCGLEARGITAVVRLSEAEGTVSV